MYEKTIYIYIITYSQTKGPRKVINAYLRPLIDELKMLQESGIDTNDVPKSQNFQMKESFI